VVVLKFDEGGWITLLVTGTLIALAIIIKRHYGRTRRLLRRLDELIQVVDMEMDSFPKKTRRKRIVDKNAQTAVLLVNGFNGLGLHTLFAIVRLFKGIYKNFVFIQVGMIDAGNFKGSAEIEVLQKHIEDELNRYVAYMKLHGFHAEAVHSIATDVVGEVDHLAPKILERFPQSIFFGGQLVFPEDSYLTRLLHNYMTFALQRKFYHKGIPFIILPIRV
jgi:hypothetical protein